MMRSGLGVLLLVAACGAETPAGETTSPASGSGERVPAGDIRDRLAAIDGMTVKAELSAPSGHRFFSLTYRQPVHHWDASQGTFEQRLTVLHRAESAPTVLASTGYDIRLSASRSEPTRLLEANQVTVEHRFFTPSRPDGASWKRLNVQQAAADHHRIVAALDQIYTAPWVSTGASKGGMTSVYHRRFYPRDVAATVAYVAPHDVDQDHDAHAAFLDSVGTDPACREGLKRTQRAALEQRDAMLALMRDYAAENGLHYVGGDERALEVMVLDVPFIFWQYGGPSGCASVPAAGASASQIFRFFDQTVGVYSYAHEDADRYIPYYYQAGTQLGYPLVADAHLRDLMKFPDAQDVRNYVPAEIEMTYRPTAMNDIDEWVKTRAERLMLVYGEYDPWSAEQFQFGPGTKDSHRYIVPRGNHGSTLSRLPAAERDEAIGRLRAWVGLGRQPDARAIAETELDVDWLMIDRPRL
jgi:hypothetical protein